MKPENQTPAPAAEAPVKRNFIQTIKYGLSTPWPEDLEKKQCRKDVLTIAWPAMMESFLLHLVSMVNTAMVGSLGTWAIASVGYCTQPRFLLMAVFQAFNTGSTALIARSKGAKNDEDANIIMHQSIMFSLLMSIALAVLGSIFAEPMVKFMGADTPETIKASTEYMKILMMTFPFNAISLAITAVLRGIGRTRISMIYNIVANLINMCVGFVFIQGRFGMPALGVSGAALGMAAGQVVAAIIALCTVIRGADMLKFRFSKLFVVNSRTLKGVINIGTPAMIEQFFMRLGQLIFAKVVASLGVQAYATHQIANNILSMTMMNGMAFGVSATSLLGQAMGRGRPDIGKAQIQLCRRYAMIFSIILACWMIFFGKAMMGMFTDEIEVIEMGAPLLVAVAFIQPLQSSQQVLSGALRGAGDTKAVAMCTFLGLVVVRPLIALPAVYLMDLGLAGVWGSLIFDQVMRSGYTMWRFASDKWKTIKVYK